jgi:hypothetical protein
MSFSVHQVPTRLCIHFTGQSDVILLTKPSSTAATSVIPSKDDPMLLEWLNSDMSTFHNPSHTFSHPQFTFEIFLVQETLQTVLKLEYLTVFDHPTIPRTA